MSSQFFLKKKAKDFLILLEKKRLKLSVIESCTGGLFSSIFTSIPGSSKVFEFGLITYSNNSKNKFSGVPKKILNSFGAVSAEVASLMSKNTYKKMNIKKGLSISCTGIAGPQGGSEIKPVGTVFSSFHFCDRNIIFHKKFFSLKRYEIQLKTVEFMIHEGIKIISHQ